MSSSYGHFCYLPLEIAIALTLHDWKPIRVGVKVVAIGQ